MNDLPKYALSVRQPWAWAIIFGGKDIENRSWQAFNHGLNRRGRIAIHASLGMTRYEFEDAGMFIGNIAGDLPLPHELERGGIIGSVEIVDVVRESASPWFMGPRGLVLRDPQPCEFQPAKGNLGFFEWRKFRTDVVPKPAKWMLPTEPAFSVPDDDLFSRPMTDRTDEAAT